MHRPLRLEWIAAALFIGHAVAADRPQLGPAPAWVLPPVTPAQSPATTEAGLQVLLNDQQLRLTTEVSEFYTASRVRVQSPQGLSAIGTVRFGWNPDKDVLTIHQLTATRGGETRNLLEGQEFTVLRREDQLEQAVLTGTLTAVLQPPGLQVGDEIEFRYTLSRRDPVVADTPDGAYIWPNTTISSVRLRALWPESMPLRHRASTHMPAAAPVTRDGWNELTYEMQNPAPLLQPTGAPARFAAMRMVEFTTFRDWQHLSQRFAPLYAKAATLAASSPLRAEITRIRQQHATPVARAEAALRLVQDEIRYVLLAMNTGGLVPATADETWERRYGDCKAKTALLLALLAGLGVQAEPVLVSTAFGDGMDTRLPGVGLFDHVMVRAKIGDKTYWLDGTRVGDRSLARLKPPEFQWGLPLLAGGSALVRIVQEPLREPQAVRTLDVDASEGITLPAPFKAELLLTGDAALGVKQTWDNVPEVNREEGFRSFWREQYHGLDIDSTQMHYDEAAGTLTWKASGRITLEWDPEYETYEPHDMSLGYRADFTRPRGTDTAAPYYVNFPTYERTVETIKLPPGRTPFTVTGSDIDRTIAGVEYRRKAVVHDNRFTMELSTRSIAAEFPASQRTEAERVLLEMSRNNLFLKKPENYLPTAKELRANAGQERETAQDYYLLALQMLQRNLREEALTELAKAVEMDPAHADSRLLRGQESASRGKLDAALVDFEAGMSANPDHVRLATALTRLRIQRGEVALALPVLDAVLARKQDGSLQLLRARALMLLGRLEEALREVQAGLAAGATPAEANPLLLELHSRQGRSAEVGRLAQESRATMITNANGLFILASYLESLGELALAKQYFGEGLAIKPDALAFVARARLSDDKPAVLADIRRGLDSADAPSSVYDRAAEVLLDRGWYRDAVEILDKYDEDKGISYRAIAMRGIAHWLLGDRAAAAKDFEAARQSAPDEGLNNLCWDKAIHRTALDLALSECDAALADLPDCGPCLDSRGMTLLQLGRYREAIAAYDASLQHGWRPPSVYGRGIARLRVGEREAGERDLVQAMQHAVAVKQVFDKAGLTP